MLVPGLPSEQDVCKGDVVLRYWCVYSLSLRVVILTSSGLFIEDPAPTSEKR